MSNTQTIAEYISRAEEAGTAELISGFYKDAQDKDMPPTFEQFIGQFLFEHGLFEDQVQQIIEALKADPASEPMQGRWNDRISDYPAPMLQVTGMIAKRKAVEWIDENMPLHFARPLLAGELPGQSPTGAEGGPS